MAEQPSKRLKMGHSSILPEIRNTMYELAALPDGVKREHRLFTTIGKDGVIKVSEGVQSFYLDAISTGGQSELFSKSIVQVSEITQEVLTLVLPQILFQVRSPQALKVFAETFNAHMNVCDKIPELHIELNLTWSMKEEDIIELGQWTASEMPHGREFMGKYVADWFSAIALLPESTHVHLHMIFSNIWRNFRELRGLSTKFGICKRSITFQFPIAGLSDEDSRFYKAQTMAAVEDVETKEQINISASRREKLVNLGCRGFNQVRQRPNV